MSDTSINEYYPTSEETPQALVAGEAPKAQDET